MVAYTKHDLQFILDGIDASEEHATQSGGDVRATVNGVEITISDLIQITPEESRQILLGLIPNALEPIGMRTISGEYNNLFEGQSDFGATGEFPRRLDPDYRDDGATGDGTGNPESPFALGPGGPFVTNTDYGNSDGAGFSGPPGPISNGDVVDSDPRIISNLIVDQSVNNPIAAFAAGFDPSDPTGTYDAGLDGIIGTADDVGTENGSIIIDPDTPLAPGHALELSGNEFFFIPNTAPDEGLSAPFNSWMTFFGQFFDHGLDLVAKGGSGTVFIPLQPDDPLWNPAPGAPNFMVLTRATV
ncbi:MAG: hypothetical protein ACR2OX_02795, partial [Methyloligellaceae bacterium]